MTNNSLSPGPRARAKERRRSDILTAAISLFCTQGIENTSLEQISASAGIGSATIYRYFPTKADLLKAAILHCWQEKSTKFLPLLQDDDYLLANGRKQLNRILELFLALYREAPDFLRFVQTFDRYLQSGAFADGGLPEYEAMLSDLKRYATDALEKGLSDGTLYYTATTDEVYFSIFHAMLSTTQKLALQGNLLSMNGSVPGERQLYILKDLLLQGLAPTADCNSHDKHNSAMKHTN